MTSCQSPSVFEQAKAGVLSTANLAWGNDPLRFLWDKILLKSRDLDLKEGTYSTYREHWRTTWDEIIILASEELSC